MHWSDRLNAWVLTRYDDIHAALCDGRLASGKRVQSYSDNTPCAAREQLQPLCRQIGKWIGNMDPPDHTRLRRLVNVAFTPRMVEKLQPAIESLAHDLLDRARADNEIDFIEAFAYPLPAIVIAQMLGVPIEQRDNFMAWSDALAPPHQQSKPLEVARGDERLNRH